MTERIPKSIWNKLRTQTSSLGENFWEEITGLVPSVYPRVDVYQVDGEVVVVIELPGIRKEQVKLKIIGHNSLEISGTTPYPYPVEENALSHGERIFGVFSRKIKLPSSVSSQNVRADFYRGVLTVYLNVIETEEEESISIQFTKNDTHE